MPIGTVLEPYKGSLEARILDELKVRLEYLENAQGQLDHGIQRHIEATKGLSEREAKPSPSQSPEKPDRR